MRTPRGAGHTRAHWLKCAEQHEADAELCDRLAHQLGASRDFDQSDRIGDQADQERSIAASFRANAEDCDDYPAIDEDLEPPVTIDQYSSQSPLTTQTQ